MAGDAGKSRLTASGIKTRHLSEPQVNTVQFQQDKVFKTKKNKNKYSQMSFVSVEYHLHFLAFV